MDNEIEEREKEFSAAFEKRLAAHAARREAAQKAFEEELDPEQVEERLRRLYGRVKPVMGEDLGVTEATLATILQPQASDPKLWLAKCRPGKERAAVAALLRGLTIIGDNLGIFSVIGRDSLKGFIYIEAHKVADVMNAVQKTKVNHLIFASPINRPVMVPLSEMADVMSASVGPGKATTDASAFSIGGWVRVKRGKYVGDLAQVVEVDQESTGEGIECIVRVKLLPRLSYRRGSGGKNERPTARPFDAQEASQYGSVTKARGYWIFNGEAYKDGFLYKDVRGSSLVVNDVTPRADELERFGALSISGTGVEVVPESMLIKYAKGERIIVLRGEFQHMTGIVDAEPEGDMVLIRFDEESFKEPVRIHSKYLGRRLEVGNMVRIALGDHAGKSGMIVSMEQSGGKKQAVVFLTMEDQQVTIPSTYLVSLAGSDISVIPTRPPKRGEASVELHDLVTIENDDGEAGIILRILGDEQHATLLDINGQTRRVSLKNLRKVPKPPSQGPTKFDPTIFKADDRVQVNDSNESRPAKVIHVFRTLAFLQAIDTGEVLARPLTLLSRPSAFPGTEVSREQRSNVRGPPLRHLIGKSVTISGASPYKGYVGIVKEITDTMARIELHTDSKVVNVPRECITGSGVTGKTPSWSDSKTPSWGGSSSAKTPAWGSTSAKTPAWGAPSAKTPAWGASSAKTPSWGGSSARTPAWGGSSSAKTPAWGASSSAKTPAWGTSSAKTPAWGSTSAKTPAWGANSSAKTPAWQGGGGGGSGLPSWIIQDAELSSRTHNVTGRVLSILPSGLVQLSGQSDPLPAADLVPVPPSKKDIVRLLNDDRATGTVIGLDGPDAVIRVDGTADFRIVPINSLVKIGH